MEIVDLADEFVHDASDETEDVQESLADEFVHDASDETEDVRESLGDSEVFSRCKRAVVVASCFVGSARNSFCSSCSKLSFSSCSRRAPFSRLSRRRRSSSSPVGLPQ